MSTASMPTAVAEGQTKALGYKTYSIGEFSFRRDESFAYIMYPGGRHVMRIEDFLRALMRDVAWGFFYGTVNFDQVFGTVNHYGPGSSTRPTARTTGTTWTRSTRRT